MPPPGVPTKRLLERPCPRCGGPITHNSTSEFNHAVKVASVCLTCRGRRISEALTARGRRVDLTGQRFGLLTVSRFVRFNPRKQAIWLCRCDCGTVKEVAGTGLRYSPRTGRLMTSSCGCNRYHPREPHIWLMNEYRGGAKARGLPFELTDGEFRSLISSPCHWCGAPPSRALTEHKRKLRKSAKVEDFRWNGIDRLDSSKGYIAGNVTPCCFTCNQMKMDRSSGDFLAAISAIYHHQIALKAKVA